MSDIFISYASVDRERARQLAEALEGEGWSVWWDREIPVGENFDQVLADAIDRAHCAIVLWSANALASDYVLDEAQEGRDRGILAPVFLEEVRAPMGFRRIQAADLRDWKGQAKHPEFQKLCRVVKQRLAVVEDSPDTTTETEESGKPGSAAEIKDKPGAQPSGKNARRHGAA
jgi:hypothetical protein